MYIIFILYMNQSDSMDEVAVAVSGLPCKHSNSNPLGARDGVIIICPRCIIPYKPYAHRHTHPTPNYKLTNILLHLPRFISLQGSRSTLALMAAQPG